MKCLYLTLDLPAPFHPHNELKYEIKLALKPSGRADPVNPIEVPFDYTFMGGLSLAGKVRRESHGSKIYGIDPCSDLTPILGEKWPVDTRKGKGVFVEAAFTKVYEVRDYHADREYHKAAVTACDTFVEWMSGRRESLAVQLQRGMRDTIQKNRQMLSSIVEKIILCGHQNIALHGHRDSGTDLEVQGAPSNHGNFWALLNFRITAGDTHLRDHLQRAAINTTYTFPDTQNQLISILDHICDTILGKVGSSLCYTVIADEVRLFQ